MKKAKFYVFVQGWGELHPALVEVEGYEVRTEGCSLRFGVYRMDTGLWRGIELSSGMQPGHATASTRKEAIHLMHANLLSYGEEKIRDYAGRQIERYKGLYDALLQ
jgi:hypothetical protein